MSQQPKAPHESSPPEAFVTKVSSELSAQLVQQRWQAVNVILRLAILTGLQMQLEATLNLLGDFALEIVPYDRALIYFWNEEEERFQLRSARNLEQSAREILSGGNVLNVWAAQFNRPLLVDLGRHAQVDGVLHEAQAQSALVIPLFVGNRVLGSMQLFSAAPKAFQSEDAQLLWLLSLVGEGLLTRDYLNEGLIRFAFTDYLTGLKTRGYFEQQLELEIKRSERRKSHFALLMIDIDYFKQLNDRYGHHVGDQVLREVAAILMKDMREVDTVARYGGEEFVIVLPETSGPGAQHVAERVRRAVERARFFAGSPDEVERLTISIGIAIFQQDAELRQPLIESADAALYSAKTQGRNRTVLYSDLVRERRRGVS